MINGMIKFYFRLRMLTYIKSNQLIFKDIKARTPISYYIHKKQT